jgi:hypothetical protein
MTPNLRHWSHSWALEMCHNTRRTNKMLKANLQALCRQLIRLLQGCSTNPMNLRACNSKEMPQANLWIARWSMKVPCKLHPFPYLRLLLHRKISGEKDLLGVDQEPDFVISVAITTPQPLLNSVPSVERREFSNRSF